MSPSGRPTGTEVNAFLVDGRYLVAHYFEGETVFGRLRPYYDNQHYRFEIPPGELDELRAFLADHGYEVLVFEETGPFTVVVEQYTAHPETVFADSILQRAVQGYNCFLLTDQYAVARAVAEGATRLPDTDLPDPFG